MVKHLRCPLGAGGQRGSPLKTKEPPKRPNRLSRRHSWKSISGRIRSSDDNLRLRHAYRVDELIESGRVRKREANTPMRYVRAKARIVRTMNAVSALREKDRMGLSHSRE